MARDDLDVPRSYQKMLRDKLSHRRVGLIVDWGRSRSHDEAAVALTAHLVSLGPRNDSDREQPRFVESRHSTERRTWDERDSADPGAPRCRYGRVRSPASL